MVSVKVTAVTLLGSCLTNVIRRGRFGGEPVLAILIGPLCFRAGALVLRPGTLSNRPSCRRLSGLQPRFPATRRFRRHGARTKKSEVLPKLALSRGPGHAHNRQPHAALLKPRATHLVATSMTTGGVSAAPTQRKTSATARPRACRTRMSRGMLMQIQSVRPAGVGGHGLSPSIRTTPVAC